MRTHIPKPSRRLAAAALAVVLVGSLAGTSPSAAEDGSVTTRWAPVAKAKIHPGVQMYTKGAQCTGNFVFKDRRGRVYVGYAAHCAGTGAATDTNGCKAKSLRLGTRVRFAEQGSLVSDGTTVGRGRLAYSSWRTMRRIGTTAPNACAYNDFALVRVGARHVGKVNPTVPFWGGPVGLSTSGSAVGDQVYSYGSSSLRADGSALSPKTGTSLGQQGRGWSHEVYTATPGVPGDSGSAFLDPQGRALGVLSTLAIAPLAGSNGVGDLSRELAYAQRHSGIPGLRLVRGTKPFSPVL